MDFLRREDGAVALIFGLMAIPFIALVGWSVDYLRLHHVKDFLQAQADAAAIHALAEDTPEGQWRLAMLGEIQRQYQGDWARDITIEGDWVGGGDEFFRVTASADVPLAFMLVIPGIPDVQLVSVAATAQLIKPVEIREPPVSTTLDPEAGDYNRIWMYCFWPDRPENDATQPRRTHMTPIADNGGSVYTADLARSDPALVADYNGGGLNERERGVWERKADSGGNRQYLYFIPQCPSGASMSFRLENVRFARTQPNYWDSGNYTSHGYQHSGRFDYFTDTYFPAGAPSEQYAHLKHPATGLPVNILETVLCDTEEQCRPVSQGGIIPEGKNRTPQTATGNCEPGKYMYYGWEDRPPGQPGPAANWEQYAWTDGDFDDIRIVIKCPVFIIEGERNARLVG